jgi:nucleoside permease NupC
MGMIWNIYSKSSIAVAVVLALLALSAVPHIFEIAAILLGLVAGLIFAGIIKFYETVNKATANVLDTETPDP